MASSTDVTHTHDTLTKLKVPDLKALCKARNLLVGGNKAVLIDRLLGQPAPEVSSRKRAAADHTGDKPKKKSKAATKKLPAAPPEDEAEGSSAVVSLPGLEPLALLSAEEASTPTSQGPATVTLAVVPVAQQAPEKKAAPGKQAPAKTAATKVPSKKATTSEKAPAVKKAVAPKVKAVPAKKFVAPAAAPKSSFQLAKAAPKAVPVPSTSADSSISALAIPSPKELPTQTHKAPSGPTGIKVTPKSANFRPLPRVKPVTTTIPPLEVTRTDLDWLPAVLNAAYKAADHDAAPSYPRSDPIAQRFMLARAAAMLFSHDMGVVDPTFLSSAVLSTSLLKPGLAQITLSDGSTHTVLSDTGELIGRASDEGVRADWERLLRADGPNRDLLDLVRTDDAETYSSGMARTFGGGPLELQVARSFILSHVSPRAVSGTWQSVLGQQGEFTNGAADTGSLDRIRAARGSLPVGLYLPATHCIESVSLAGLHPAIAVVQTSSRANYVLRLCGASVGDEDEGVLQEWCELLGCDARGR